MRLYKIWYYTDPTTRIRTYRSWRLLRFTRAAELKSSIGATEGVTDVRVINNGNLEVTAGPLIDWEAIQPEVSRCIAGNIPWGSLEPIKGVVFKRLRIPRWFIRRLIEAP